MIILIRFLLFVMQRRLPRFTLFPYTTLFRSVQKRPREGAPPSDSMRIAIFYDDDALYVGARKIAMRDRKSTRLNSSHANISYAVFCLKKKKNHYADQQSDEDSLEKKPNNTAI